MELSSCSAVDSRRLLKREDDLSNFHFPLFSILIPRAAGTVEGLLGYFNVRSFPLLILESIKLRWVFSPWVLRLTP